MKKIFRKEVLIGLIVVIALAVLFIGINFLKGVNVFKAANYYYVSFTDVQGLAQSAPVTVNGFKVGQVREIQYEYDNPGHVLVELSLDRNLKVPSGSKAVLSSDILGTATITLDMAKSGEYHKVGDKLIGVTPKGMMDNVSNELLPSLSGIFPKVDTLLTAINALVGSPELAQSVKRLDAITANLEATTAAVSSAAKPLPALVGDARHITANLQSMTGHLDSLTAALNEMPLNETIANVKTITANLSALTTELQSSDSSLGLLLHDPRLYNNLNATVSSLDSLFVDIKAHPKRYLKFSVF